MEAGDGHYLFELKQGDGARFVCQIYDPKVDSRLDSLNGVGMRADGAPTGTWQLHSERPLPAGEYVVVFRLHGSGNWDRQAVLVRLDPKLAPAAKGQ